MYKAIIQDTAILSIRNFIKKYLEVFLNIYTDTGIPNVDIIIENYYSSSTELRNEIYKSMIMTFESEVLAKYSSSQGKLYSIITVGNFRLFVYYSEEGYNRFIDDIEIFRK